MIVLIVAKNELIRNLKNKKKLLLMLLLPLVSIVVAIGINSLMKPSINIGIIENQYNNNYIEKKLNNIDDVKVSYAKKETINTDMILAKYIGVIEFKENNKFEVYCLDKDMKLDIEKALAYIITTGKVDIIKKLLDTMEEDSLSAAQRSSGFIFMTLMITCTISASIMLNDKEDRILTRYSVSPNKIYSYVLGNYIFNTINTILQIIISAILVYLLKIEIGISMSQFIVLGVLIAIVSSSIATLIVVLSKNELQSSLLASSIALLMSLFGGAFLPIEKMPEALKFVSNISITKWIIELTSLLENGKIYGESLVLITSIFSLSLVIACISMSISRKALI